MPGEPTPCPESLHPTLRARIPLWEPSSPHSTARLAGFLSSSATARALLIKGVVTEPFLASLPVTVIVPAAAPGVPSTAD